MPTTVLALVADWVERVASASSRVAIKPGKTKVQNLDLTGGCDYDIGGLDVAMDDATIVRMCQSGGDLRAITQDQLWAQASRGDQQIERRALDEFHHDEVIGRRPRPLRR